MDERNLYTAWPDLEFVYDLLVFNAIGTFRDLGTIMSRQPFFIDEEIEKPRENHQRLIRSLSILVN